MILERSGAPLVSSEVPDPTPGPGQVLLSVRACGVCRTDLHIVDGELADPKLPLVLGHQVVGEVVGLGSGVTDVAIGDRVGVPWLGWTCGHCAHCRAGRENLCERAEFTGYTRDGGYAERMVADAAWSIGLPGSIDDVSAAPLLCAGMIGYRAYRMAGDAKKLGLYGFGSAAHLLAQVAIHEGREVFAFTRDDDLRAQVFARSIGATWSGGSGEPPPEPLDAAIIFAPVGDLVPVALAAVRPAGVVVCAGIHMSDIPAFPYALLWMERAIRSVANLTRDDGRRFLAAAEAAGVHARAEPIPLGDANLALRRLREGDVEGSLVLIP